MKKHLLMFISIICISTILTACSNYKFKEDYSYPVEDFKVTDHHGETITLDSLKGKPWLAMFIFTNCKTICQPMTYNMTVIQEELVKHGVEDYEIVAFSVDPATDTPEVLAKYLSHYTVPDESKWHLVTGYDQKFIEQFALNSFRTIVKMPQEGDQVIHTSYFYIVDEKGNAVKNYYGYDEKNEGVQYETIAMDLKTLIEERLGK